MTASTDWPNKDVLLATVKESTEHIRAWKLVAGLSKTIMSEREGRSMGGHAHLVGNKPETWSDRINTLEAKIVGQKERIRQLEECRTFEKETEQLLVEALCRIANDSYFSVYVLRQWAGLALDEFNQRMGPRPT